MLTLLTTEEFAAWFRNLADAAAEEVATALELIELMGPDASPPNSSELLLWYESASGAPRIDAFYRADFMPVLERMRQIMQHLESEEVRERLATVPFERAQRASEALRQVRGRLRPALHLMHRGEGSVRELEASYRNVLDALGLREAAPRPAGPALRELCLRKREPGMRIMYGVDVPTKRALVVWGEHLDRNAYGPSVRRALALWQEFRSGAHNMQLQQRSER